MLYLVYDSAYNSVTQRFKFTISKISIFYSLEHMQLYKNIEDTMSWNFELNNKMIFATVFLKWSVLFYWYPTQFM